MLACPCSFVRSLFCLLSGHSKSEYEEGSTLSQRFIIDRQGIRIIIVSHREKKRFEVDLAMHTPWPSEWVSCGYVSQKTYTAEKIPRRTPGPEQEIKTFFTFFAILTHENDGPKGAAKVNHNSS